MEEAVRDDVEESGVAAVPVEDELAVGGAAHARQGRREELLGHGVQLLHPSLAGDPLRG